MSAPADSAVAAAARGGELPRSRSWSERALAVVPLASVVVWLAMLYVLEAAAHASPTIFTDELEWAQLSRSIAETGHAARRGDPIFFKSLYAYLVAPAWLADDTSAAYALAKYLNVLVMCLAAIPAYLLARRLVSKPLALFVGAATIAIPSMAYSLYLLPEVLAYPYATLCAWLCVESLAGRGRGWTAAAVVACAGAPLVRAQLVVVPAAFALAAAALFWLGPRGRRLRAGWSALDHVGAALLAVGILIVLNRWIGHRSYEWWWTTEFWRGRIVHFFLWSAGALTIGLGILPVLGGLLSLAPDRAGRSPQRRAFAAFLASAIVTFGLYTGVKGAFLSTQIYSRASERNLIYLAPLLFAGTALVLQRGRIRLVPLALGVGALGALLAWTPLQFDYPYFESFGFSIGAMANRHFFWDATAVRTALFVTLAVCALVLLAARWAHGRVLAGRGAFAARAGLALVALLLVGWNLTGEVTAAVASNRSAERLLDNFADPPDWVDEQTGGAEVTYLGQQLIGLQLGVNLLEFWNRSIVNVWSTDGTAPAVGPTVTPDLAAVDGTLSRPPGTPYVLADNGVVLRGQPVASWKDLRLYRIDGPIRLARAVTGLYPDGWMVADAGFSQFATPGNRGGVAEIVLSRAGFCADTAPPGRATVKVGRLAIGDDKQPTIGRLWARRTVPVPNCEQTVLRVPVEPPPWRVEVHVEGTFRPNEYGLPDGRELGAVFGVEFRDRQAR